MKLYRRCRTQNRRSISIASGIGSVQTDSLHSGKVLVVKISVSDEKNRYVLQMSRMEAKKIAHAILNKIGDGP